MMILDCQWDKPEVGDESVFDKSVFDNRSDLLRRAMRGASGTHKKVRPARRAQFNHVASFPSWDLDRRTSKSAGE